MDKGLGLGCVTLCAALASDLAMVIGAPLAWALGPGSPRHQKRLPMWLLWWEGLTMILASLGSMYSAFGLGCGPRGQKTGSPWALAPHFWARWMPSGSLRLCPRGMECPSRVVGTRWPWLVPWLIVYQLCVIDLVTALSYKGGKQRPSSGLDPLSSSGRSHDGATTQATSG